MQCGAPGSARITGPDVDRSVAVTPDRSTRSPGGETVRLVTHAEARQFGGTTRS